MHTHARLECASVQFMPPTASIFAPMSSMPTMSQNASTPSIVVSMRSHAVSKQPPSVRRCEHMATDSSLATDLPSV